MEMGVGPRGFKWVLADLIELFMDLLSLKLANQVGKCSNQVNCLCSYCTKSLRNLRLNIHWNGTKKRTILAANATQFHTLPATNCTIIAGKMPRIPFSGHEHWPRFYRWRRRAWNFMIYEYVPHIPVSFCPRPLVISLAFAFLRLQPKLLQFPSFFFFLAASPSHWASLWVLERLWPFD